MASVRLEGSVTHRRLLQNFHPQVGQSYEHADSYLGNLAIDFVGSASDRFHILIVQRLNRLKYHGDVLHGLVAVPREFAQIGARQFSDQDLRVHRMNAGSKKKTRSDDDRAETATQTWRALMGDTLTNVE